MLRMLRNARRRSWADQWLFVQAYTVLGIARLAIIALPFRRLSGLLGEHLSESPTEVPPQQLAEARRVSWAVRRASSFTPWKSNCFPQAITAQFLLRRRGIPSTLYLGGALDGPDSMKAHAWLRCGPWMVTGGRGHRHFGVVAMFATCDSRGRTSLKAKLRRPRLTRS
jgi:hypothetical protein